MMILVPIAIVVTLFLAVEVGYQTGKRRARRFPADQRVETGAVQGAMLGILGLLLGFSFAGAAGRFIERQDLISREANAIGTAHRRADLLDQPHADELRHALVAYLGNRLEMSRSLRFALSPDEVARIAADHDRIWDAALRGVEARPAAMNVVVPVVNEVLDLHDFRVAAGRKHLPGLILGLLGACSVLTLGVMGFASALGRHRNIVMVSGITILVAAALWTTIDLDWSRIGLVRVSDQALIELHAGLTRTE